jgi:hypothetical protein
MLEGLDKVMQRGEQLEQLQEKTEGIRSVGSSLHRKSKKMNSWWNNFKCIGCGGSEMSRGAMVKMGKISYKANKQKGELGLL